MIGHCAVAGDVTTRAMIFAHWDPNGLVDDHVLYAMERYRPWVTRLVFVSTNYQRRSRPLEQLCDQVIIRENVGFDLLSWKAGLEAIKVDAYDEIVFTNDSIYGPLKTLNTVFSRDDIIASDLWGMTISEEHERHLQSYFFAMKRRVLLSDAGRDLWNGIPAMTRQRDIIEMYEMRLLKEFEREGFSARAIFDGAEAMELPWREKAANIMRWPPRIQQVRKHIRCLKHWPYNPTHLQWRQCVEAGVPFVKVDLFRDNPNHVRLSRVRRWITENTDYPLDLIHRHQSRLRRN